MDENYISNIVSAGRSIPGQSLTNDFDQRYEFEKAPQITNLRDGIEYFFPSKSRIGSLFPSVESVITK